MRYLTAIIAVAISVPCATMPTPAHAWGEYGHLTVCDLAYRNLTKTSKEAVNRILNSRNGGTFIPATGDSEARHYTSFNVGCLEEDSRPKKHPKDHFLNVDRGLTTISGDSCPLSPSTGNQLACVFSGLRRDLRILRDSSQDRRERVVALMAIGHWIGDLHQPLHISYETDVGGNNINVSYSGWCGLGGTGKPYRPGNFHSVWDNCLLERGLFQRVRESAAFRPNWSRTTITYRGVDLLQSRTTLSEEQSIVRGDIWQWAAESYAITRQPSTRYCTLVGSVCQFLPNQIEWSSTGQQRRETIGDAYVSEFAPVAEERVRLAGYRLAHLLNQALDPAYTGPVKNSQQPVS